MYWSFNTLDDDTLQALYFYLLKYCTFLILFPPLLFRFKGLPPEDATWVCGRGFCQPARRQHSHGGWVSPDKTPEGLAGGWGGDNACCSVTWEGEKYWQERRPRWTGDLCLWPKGFVFLCVRLIWHTSLLLYFSPPVSVSPCLCGIASFHRVSELHPLPALPVLQKQDYLPPLRGSWCISGPVSLDTSPTVRSVPSTLLCCLSHTSCRRFFFFCTFPVSSSINCVGLWPPQILELLFCPIVQTLVCR